METGVKPLEKQLYTFLFSTLHSFDIRTDIKSNIDIKTGCLTCPLPLTIDDPSLEAAAQREAWEETGLDTPLHLFQQVHTFEDFEDPCGKYVCLLYVLSEPLSPEASIEAGDDACQCEVERSPGLRCPNTAYWRYNGIAMCPRHIQSKAANGFFTSTQDRSKRNEDILRDASMDIAEKKN